MNTSIAITVVLVVVQWCIAAWLFFFHRTTEDFVVLHRSMRWGIDLIGPVGSLSVLPIIATLLLLLHIRMKRWEEANPVVALEEGVLLRNRFMILEQCSLLAVSIVLLYWNIAR